MSAETFTERLPQNTPGKFYVDDQCTHCDLCCTTAPTLFKSDDTKGFSYIFKQPETEEELALAKESLEGCCCEAIHDDGDQFDWSAPRNSRPTWRQGDAPKPSCSHCPNSTKPWWKFWA